MACELTHWNSPDCLDALAAACAEAGDYASAAKWETRAVQLTPRTDKSARTYRVRQAMFELRHPYRD